MSRLTTSAATLWFLLAFAACMGERSTDALRDLEDAARVIREAESERAVSMNDFTNFHWDSMYIFPHYAPYAAVDAALGFSWSGVRKSRIAQRDDAYLVVWLSGDRVVAHSMDPQLRIDFDSSLYYRPQAPSNAVYRVGPSPWDPLRIALTPETKE